VRLPIVVLSLILGGLVIAVVTWTRPVVDNDPPTVNAGPDQSTQLSSDATLTGTASDDGQVSRGRDETAMWPPVLLPPLTYAWSQVTGPGTATIASPDALSTQVAFPVAGDYVFRLTVNDGQHRASDDVAVAVSEARPPPPPPPRPDVPTGADYGFPPCTGPGRNVVDPQPSGTVLTSRFRVSAPADDTTYDMSGVRATAQPASSYPFSFGTGNDNADAADRTCMIGGELLDQFGDPPPLDWRTWHDDYNAACVKIAAVDWMQVQGHVCRGIQDGFRMQENAVNANNTRFLIEDSYAGNMGDDCIENDYTTEGVILDSLFDGCHNAFSERPSGDRCWETPPGEQLVVDHSLVRLRPMQLEEGFGYGRLFKWPTQCGSMNVANQPVIKCSTFLVPDFRLDSGTDGMEFPANAVVDDSACPDDPTTIVWLGGGDTYPGNLRGLPIRTTTDIGYWNAKVADWHARHD